MVRKTRLKDGQKGGTYGNITRKSSFKYRQKFFPQNVPSLSHRPPYAPGGERGLKQEDRVTSFMDGP